MKAITVEPQKAESAQLEDVPEPDPRHGSVLVEAVAVGVCGTDVEIVEGKYGVDLTTSKSSFSFPRRKIGLPAVGMEHAER